MAAQLRKLQGFIWYWEGSVGIMGTRPFCVPHFFDYRKQPSFSLHDLPWSPMGRFKQLLNKEGRGDMRPGRNSQEQPWGKILVSPSKDTHNGIFELFGRYWNPLHVAEVLTMVCYPQTCRPWARWTWRLMLLTPTYLTTNASEECPRADHALFGQLP